MQSVARKQRCVRYRNGVRHCGKVCSHIEKILEPTDGRQILRLRQTSEPHNRKCPEMLVDAGLVDITFNCKLHDVMDK